MISNRRILLAALGVFNIVLIAVAFLVARSYNGVFWTGLVFNLLGASGFGYFSVFAYDRGRDSLRETPQNLALVYGSGLYWLFQLLFSIPAIGFDWRLRYVLPLHLLLFGVFFVYVAFLLMGRNYISAMEAEEGRTQKNISRQRERLAILERLTRKYPDDRLLEKTFEKLRYSDPAFLPELNELEQQIDRLITELAEVSSDDRSSRLEMLSELLDGRSIEIRSRKQKGF